MRRVNVAYIKPGALTREATGTQGREAALVADLRQGISLIHKLRELAAAEEFFHRRHHRADIDQSVRRRLARLLNAHALLDHALHTQQANAKLRLNQLTHAAHAAIAQVVDIVLAPMAVIQRNQAANDIHQVILRQSTLALRHRQVHLAIELIAAHAAQIVTPGIKEHILHQRASVVDRRRITGAHLLIELQQRLVLFFHRIAVQCSLDIVDIDVIIDFAEGIENALVARKIHLLAIPLLFRQATNRAQKRRHRQLALAVDLHRQQVFIAGFKLQPRASTWDQLRGKELAARGGILIGGKVDAWRTHQLADDHALGAIYNEGTFLRHQREITHEDILLDDFACLFICQARLHGQRSRIRRIAVAALVFTIFRLAKRIRRHNKFQLQIFPGEIFNGRDFFKKLAQALSLEPFKRIQLNLNQSRHWPYIRDTRKGDALRKCYGSAAYCHRYMFSSRRICGAKTPRSFEMGERFPLLPSPSSLPT